MNKPKRLYLSVLVLICLSIMCLSCNEVLVFPGHDNGRKIGHTKKIGKCPPPHAPAHGHRRKFHNGVEVIYNSGYGAYVVVGHTDHYFFDGHYYRFYKNNWQVSVSINNPKWKSAKLEILPPGLKAKHKIKLSKAKPFKAWGKLKRK